MFRRLNCVFSSGAPYTARSFSAMGFDMVPTFTLAFLDLIESELRRASKGLTSSHYLHNVGSGIANHVSLIEKDDKINSLPAHTPRLAQRHNNHHPPRLQPPTYT